jgi:hypothetical protein
MRTVITATALALVLAPAAAFALARPPLPAQTQQSANDLCTAEQADAGFAAAHGGKTFEQFYGTGNGSNAFGRCVSLKAKSSTAVERAAMPNPSQRCAALRTTLGATVFANTYGTNAGHTNAFGKCVAAMAKLQGQSLVNAAQACNALTSDPSFSQTYGTNADLSNAFGKCVSQKAQASVAKRVQQIVAAAKACKRELAAGRTAFMHKYGTNGNGANAFGKCVSQKSQSAENQSQQATINAARTCRNEQKADASAFSSKYGKARNAFGKCVSAHSKTS